MAKLEMGVCGVDASAWQTPTEGGEGEATKRPIMILGTNTLSAPRVLELGALDRI